MVVFLVVGMVGLIALAATMFVDGALDALDVGGDGLLSGPTVAAFLTAFGFGGAVAVYAGLAPAAAVAAGLVAGVAVGGLAGVSAKSLMQMSTDATPTAADLAGLRGTVVSPVPADGFGEVSVSLGGQPVKLSARSAVPLRAGEPVRVVSALSPTSVAVEPVCLEGQS
jgi:membrane protein implicated in regulation of membrane protease activity